MYSTGNSISQRLLGENLIIYEVNYIIRYLSIPWHILSAIHCDVFCLFPIINKRKGLFDQLYHRLDHEQTHICTNMCFSRKMYILKTYAKSVGLLSTQFRWVWFEESGHKKVISCEVPSPGVDGLSLTRPRRRLGARKLTWASMTIGKKYYAFLWVRLEVSYSFRFRGGLGTWCSPIVE